MLNADLKDMNFISDHDGQEVSAVLAVPSGGINGIVQIVHGMNEHKERWFDFMDYLASEGFASAVHDIRGHGASVKGASNLGFIGENGGEGIVSDMAQLNAMLHELSPGCPVFMAAFDMGALAARCYLRDHDDSINGLLLMGMPSYTKFSPVARALNGVVVSGQDIHSRSAKVNETANRVFGKGFEDTPNSWRCSKPEIVESFNNDPLCNFNYTVNGYEVIWRLMIEAYSRKGYAMKKPDLPIRFISGRDDPVMLSEKKFMKSVGSLGKVGYNSISHRIFDNMRHELINEKNNISVYRDIAKSIYSWIDRLNGGAVES